MCDEDDEFGSDEGVNVVTVGDCASDGGASCLTEERHVI